MAPIRFISKEVFKYLSLRGTKILLSARWFYMALPLISLLPDQLCADFLAPVGMLGSSLHIKEARGKDEKTHDGTFQAQSAPIPFSSHTHYMQRCR